MSRKVLTIDDKPDIRRLIRMTLEFESIDVIEAGDGVQGLALARSAKPDLILLDRMMPGMDGLAVLAALRADETLSRIPVVFLTALGTAAERDVGLKGGVREYLVKPFSPLELLGLVERLIDEAHGAARAQ